MKSILQAQVEMAPQVYESEQKYQPLYNQLQAEQQAFQAQQALDIAKKAYPQIADMESAYNQANRQAELGQLQTALPAYQQAFNALTPGYAESVAGAGQLAQSSMQQALNRPQLSAFESGIRDPYGKPTATQQPQQRSVQQAPPAPAPRPTSRTAQALQAVQKAKQAAAQRAASAKSPAPSKAPVSAVGRPGISVGQMQGPALPQGPQQQAFSNLKDTAAGEYVNAVRGFTPTNVAFGAGMPQEAGYLNQVQTAQAAAAKAGPVPSATNVAAAQSAAAAARTAGTVPTAVNMQRVAGPQLASNIQNLNQDSVNQYISAMPGMGQYAEMLAQQSQNELAAGRSLTTEEQRMADQSARAAYAARGTALGNQAVNAEILNRADVSNQRYQQRLQNAAQAAGTIQGIYQPALQQSLQRQQLGIDYGLGVQQQAFGQAQARDTMAQQIQAQRYGQAMGTQGAGFEQAQSKDTMAQQLQAQRYAQAMGAQGAGFEQAMGREGLSQQIQQQRYGQLMGQQQLMQGAQAQAYEQAMGREQLGAGTQQSAFNQALQRGQAQQQRLQAGTAIQAGQAQLGMGAMSQLQAAQAPVLQAFYKQPILQGQEGQAQQMAMAMQQQAGPQYFNPESQTGMGSIYGAYNSQMNLAGAQAQANAAAKAGKSSMFGQLGGAAIGGAAMLLCWVAREVYGTENPKWMQFREWLLANADDDFIDAYIQHGPKVAEFISDKPELKNMIRSWMDSKIS